MSELDDFLSEVLPQLEAEITAIHNGDTAPRKALWSRHDPLTLFGAKYSGRGWGEIEPIFDKLAQTFTGSESFAYELVGADTSGDLGYVVGIERSVAAIDGTMRSYALRVTTILRREAGAWKVVHRHGDALGDNAQGVVASL